MLYTMKEALQVAQTHRFALPAFNISSLPIFLSVMEAAQELDAPIIVEVHPDELRFITSAFVETMKSSASAVDIPVVLHLDHGSSLEDVETALACGFRSVMIDGSELSFEENVALTQKVVALAHKTGVSVEAELGTIGKTGTSIEGGSTQVLYTEPNQAKEFVERTGIDTLAVAIGTAHGIYPTGYVPKLQLKLLQEIHDRVKIPLVLHGGSSNADEEVVAAIENGICKVNISSDVKRAFFEEVRITLQKHPQWYEPNQIYIPCMEAAKQVIEHKIKLFQADGKAKLYR